MMDRIKSHFEMIAKQMVEQDYVPKFTLEVSKPQMLRLVTEACMKYPLPWVPMPTPEEIEGMSEVTIALGGGSVLVVKSNGITE